MLVQLSASTLSVSRPSPSICLCVTLETAGYDAGMQRLITPQNHQQLDYMSASAATHIDFVLLYLRGVSSSGTTVPIMLFRDVRKNVAL